jgi:hypothetical protein
MKITQIENKKLSKQAESDYRNAVSTEITIVPSTNDNRSYDYERNEKVNVAFNIEMERRSWGIKGAMIVLTYIEPFFVEIHDGDTEEVLRTIQVEVEPRRLEKVTGGPSGMIGLGGMEIYTDLTGNVDYSKSKIYTFEF